jgi:hypothetical protein
MATLTVDNRIVDGDTVTATTLHNLIEDATIDGLVGSDFSGAATLLVAQATAPDPSEFPFWFDTTYTGQNVRVYAAPWNIWVTVGPERFEVPFKATQDFASGALVTVTGASECGPATGVSVNALGFAQDTGVSGSWVPIAACGIGWVFVASGSTDSGSFGQQCLIAQHNPGDGSVSTPGGFNSAGGGGNPLTELAFGYLLDNTVTKPRGRLAMLWGPKEVRSMPL